MIGTTTTPHSSYLYLCAGFALMALAFSTFVPASTETVMTAMPAQKAGAASAINQMTRQLGQALGVALVGSVAASGYRGGFTLERAPGVPRSALEAAGTSITGAIRAAQGLGGPARAVVLDAAHDAFIHGMRLALGVTATLAVLGAIYAAKAIPSGDVGEAPPIEDELALGGLIVD